MNKSLNVVWEFEKDSKKYFLTVPYGAQYAEVYAAMNEFAADIQESEKVAVAQFKEQQEKEQAEQSKPVDIVAEPLENAVA